MEEFWLKAGGVMKYMTDVDMIDLCEQERIIFVYNHLSFDEFNVDCTRFGENYYDIWSSRQKTVEYYKNQYAFCQLMIKQLKEELGVLEKERLETIMPPTPDPTTITRNPELLKVMKNEQPVLQSYKDPNVEPLKVFSYAGAEYKYNGEGSEWSLPVIGGKSYGYAGDTETKFTPQTSYEKYNAVAQDFKPVD